MLMCAVIALLMSSRESLMPNTTLSVPCKPVKTHNANLADDTSVTAALNLKMNRKMNVNNSHLQVDAHIHTLPQNIRNRKQHNPFDDLTKSRLNAESIARFLLYHEYVSMSDCTRCSRNDTLDSKDTLG